MADDRLSAALRPVERRSRRASALRGASVGLAAGGIAALVGGPGWLALGLGGAAIGGLWPVDARAVAARLDAAAGLDGALRCAWDHRADGRPMARAQRRQALAALDARRAAIADPPIHVRAAPAPAAGWLLGPLLAILPFVVPPAGAPPSAPGDPGAPEAAVGAPATEPGAEVEPAAPEVAPAESRAVAEAPEVDPDAGRAEQPDAGERRAAADGGAGGAVRARGVAGSAVGESGGGPSSARPVTATPGEGPMLVLPAAAGDRPAGEGPAGRLVVGRTPPPPDAIADPARPYPSRYRQAIAAWFDRSRP